MREPRKGSWEPSICSWVGQKLWVTWDPLLPIGVWNGCGYCEGWRESCGTENLTCGICSNFRQLVPELLGVGSPQQCSVWLKEHSASFPLDTCILVVSAIHNRRSCHGRSCCETAFHSLFHGRLSWWTDATVSSYHSRTKAMQLCNSPWGLRDSVHQTGSGFPVDWILPLPPKHTQRTSISLLPPAPTASTPWAHGTRTRP